MMLFLIACAKHSHTPAESHFEKRELLVWELKKGDVVSHLVGTCHLPIPVGGFIHDTDLLTQARKVIVEVDPDTIDPDSIAEHVYDPDLSHLNDVGRKEMAGISRRARPVPASVLNHMPSWTVQAMLASDDLLSGGAESNGVPVLDSAIAALAKAHGVALGTIETVEEQVEMFASLETDLPTSAARANEGEMVDAMTLACYRGQLEQVAALLREAKDDTSVQEIFTQRNLSWFPRIEPELEDGGVVVAVGAGHMVGATGLPAQAREAGFRVKRLSGRVVSYPLPPPAKRDAIAVELLPDEFVEPMKERVSREMCANEQALPPCLRAGPCLDEVATNVMLCLDQWGSDMHAIQSALSDPDEANRWGSCVVGSFIFRALSKGEEGKACLATISGQ